MANRMRRCAVNLIASVIALLAPALSSCAGDDETPPGEYSEPCDLSMTCAMNLECFAAVGICSQSCGTSQECQLNLGTSTTVCVGGVCQEPCNATDFNPCLNGLKCIQSGAGATCRVQQ